MIITCEKHMKIYYQLLVQSYVSKVRIIPEKITKKTSEKHTLRTAQKSRNILSMAEI